MIPEWKTPKSQQMKQKHSFKSKNSESKKNYKLSKWESSQNRISKLPALVDRKKMTIADYWREMI